VAIAEHGNACPSLDSKAFLTSGDSGFLCAINVISPQIHQRLSGLFQEDRDIFQIRKALWEQTNKQNKTNKQTNKQTNRETVTLHWCTLKTGYIKYNV
jgi:hypothetical protein